MKDVLLFIYTYYEFYIYLIVGFGTSVFSYMTVIRSKIQRIISKCYVIVGSYVINSFFAIVFTRNIKAFALEENAFLYPILIKIVLSIIIGYLCIYVLCLLENIVKKVLQFSLIRNNQYGWLIFGFTLINFMLNLPNQLEEWSMVWYATDYSMGIGSRFFIGTLLTLFYDDYLEQEVAYKFCIMALLFLIVGVSYLLNQLIVKSKLEYRKAVVFLVFCFVSCPGYIRGMWTPGNLGRLETYSFLLIIISIICFCKLKQDWLKYGIVTVLACISMAIYQGNIFMYYPLVIMMIVYDILDNWNTKEKYHKIVNGILSIMIVCVSFLFFQFFSWTVYDNATEMCEAIIQKSDVSVNEMAVRLEMFEPITSAYREINQDFILGKEYPRERTFLTLCIMIPITVLIIAMYMKCGEWRKQSGKKTLLSPYIYFGLSSLAIVPQFLLNVDWGRWMISLTVVLFFGIFYLIYKKDKGMDIALNALVKFIDTHRFLAILVVTYLAMLSPFSERDFIPEVNTLTEWFWKLRIF